MHMRKRYLSIKAIKKQTLEDTFKALSDLNKALIDSEHTARMTVENLEDIRYFEPEAINTLGGQYKQTVECMRAAIECIQDAGKYCSEAKQGLRVIFPQEPDAPLPNNTTVNNPEVSSYRQYRRLKRHYRRGV